MPSVFTDLVRLIYPSLCIGCECESIERSELFCVYCESVLQVTDFHLVRDNEAKQRLANNVVFQFGAAMYRFYPGGLVQKMLHRIKYQGETHVAVKLGERYGGLLSNSPILRDVYCIVPVPLHPNRQRYRGYNQSAHFAMGLSQVLQKPVDTKNLIRIIDTSTQTSKTKAHRLKDMLGAFKVRDLELWSHKHILLVDDVLTTGSTLESCSMALIEVAGIRLSFCTIAVASE